jgi:hypothetical protein
VRKTAATATEKVGVSLIIGGIEDKPRQLEHSSICTPPNQRRYCASHTYIRRNAQR